MKKPPKKDEMRPPKTWTDNLNIGTSVTVNKKELKKLRKELEEDNTPKPSLGEQPAETVVYKLDSSTFMPKDENPRDIRHSVRDVLILYLESRITKEEVHERLSKLKVNPSFVANKIWLNKVIAEYFYGVKFKKLIELIREL